MRWFCMNCVKPLEETVDIPEIFNDIFTGQLGVSRGHKAALDGRPLCPDCGCVCIQVKDEEEPENADL